MVISAFLRRVAMTSDPVETTHTREITVKQFESMFILVVE